MKPRTVTRETLFEILSWGRPHDSDTEVQFCKEFIDKAHPDMTRDAFGNRMLRIGTAPILWSCHVDTVCVKGQAQLLDFDPATGIVKLAKGKPGMSLGADDGAGVFIMLAMIEAGIEGLYVFHRGEERGCLGSRWIVENTPELLKGIDAAIAFDRTGYGDIITHQSFGMTASDEFAWSLAEQLNRHNGLKYQPDNTGVYTDTNEYADLIAECSNLSVAYFGNHGPAETLDVYHVEALLDAMLKLDLDALTIKRQPGEGGWQSYMGGGYSGGGWRSANSQIDNLIEAILDCPAAAAELMLGKGITADDVLDLAWSAPLDPAERQLNEAYDRAWRDDEEDDDPFPVLKEKVDEAA